MTRGLVAVTAALALSVTGGAVAAPAQADPRETAKTSTATGYGGAVSTVDPEASAAAIEVLRKGGNAADAAVAAAATLGVTEPYSAGIGGGGYFVFYDAKTGKVGTIDGRETAPAGMPHDAFIDPATGKPFNFTPELVTSGVSVGVPGTPATWARALDRWGTLNLGDALKPA
ncbi:gamma-glutamyltransferase, partial [Microbacterium sp. Bi128]|uniref:gamma-glutamyltransferase n=1 Tax=Microbacterium sp. Bi128 TaxID=2821115 RepID=UPI0035ABF05C